MPSTATPTPPPTATATRTPTPTLAEIVSLIRPAVVLIETPEGTGSGFIFDSQGYVLTNAHVVGIYRDVSVVLEGKFEFTGRVVGLDEPVDLAVIRIEASGPFSTIPIGDSGEIDIGDDVTAAGYPLGSLLGTDITITKGILSAVRRSGEVDYLQTDAAINPGNSGGPLINAQGQVVGINTARVDDVMGRPVQNIGLAIASNTITNLLPFLMGGGMIVATPTTPPTPEPAVVYIHDILLYRLEVPDGWRIDASESDAVVIWEPETNSRVWIYTQPFPSYPTLDSFLADYSPSPSSSWLNYQIIEQSRLTYGSFPAEEFVFTYDYGGAIQMGKLHWYVISGYLLQVYAFSEQKVWVFQDYSDVRDAMETVLYGLYVSAPVPTSTPTAAPTPTYTPTP